MFKNYMATWLAILALSIFPSLHGVMHCYEYKTNIFETAVTTELTAYRLLKKNPLKKDVNYVAIPWAPCINSGKLKLLAKCKLKVNGGFTVCQHIDYKKIFPIIKQMGINVLFTPHAEPSDDPAIKVLPFPHMAVNGTKAGSKKDILYSFIGYSNHPVRKALFALPRSKDTIIKQRALWHFSGNDDRRKLAEKLEYQQVLARSRYSLCPRGTGASTLRFWESLQAGAIPVLLSDDMMLPENFDWSRCVIRLKEADVDLIDPVVRSVTPEAEKLMRKACLEAYAYFEGKNFVSVIRDYYDVKGK